MQREESIEDRISRFFSDRPDPRALTVEGQLEILWESLWPHQRDLYHAIRYHVFHLGSSYDHKPYGRYGDPKFCVEQRGYPGQYLPSKDEYEEAREWLERGGKGSGRTYLLAMCFLEKAHSFIETKVVYFDHSRDWGRAERMYDQLRDMTWEVDVFRQRVIFNRDYGGPYLAFSKAGATEIDLLG
jgi:hypothetical protein